MPYANSNIRCDVQSCKYNTEGKNCTLAQIKVTTDCTDCTCCESYCYHDEING